MKTKDLEITVPHFKDLETFIKFVHFWCGPIRTEAGYKRQMFDWSGLTGGLTLGRHLRKPVGKNEAKTFFLRSKSFISNLNEFVRNFFHFHNRAHFLILLGFLCFLPDDTNWKRFTLELFKMAECHVRSTICVPFRKFTVSCWQQLYMYWNIISGKETQNFLQSLKRSVYGCRVFVVNYLISV